MSGKNHRVKIENGRAAYAFDAVYEAVNKPSIKSSEYRSYVKKLPAMIQVNGLGQTLAFCYSKGGAYKEIYDQIYGWLLKNNPKLFPEKNEEFVKAVINKNSSEYRVITMEVLALLNWMRRFAEGMVKQEKEGE